MIKAIIKIAEISKLPSIVLKFDERLEDEVDES